GRASRAAGRAAGTPLQRSTSTPAPAKPAPASMEAPSSLRLIQHRLSLSDADAHRRDSVAAAAPAQLVQERHGQPRTAHAERVADRDRAAVHVHLLLVDAELAHDRDRLRRERLVQLDEIDVAELDTR